MWDRVVKFLIVSFALLLFFIPYFYVLEIKTNKIDKLEKQAPKIEKIDKGIWKIEYTEPLYVDSDAEFKKLILDFEESKTRPFLLFIPDYESEQIKKTVQIFEALKWQFPKTPFLVIHADRCPYTKKSYRVDLFPLMYWKNKIPGPQKFEDLRDLLKESIDSDTYPEEDKCILRKLTGRAA